MSWLTDLLHIGVDEWGVSITLALFLCGLGAGAYLAGATSDLLAQRYNRSSWRKFSQLGVYLSWPLVGLGLLLLLLDLGRADLRYLDHILNLYTNFGSMMSVGSMLLTLFVAWGLITSLLWWAGWKEMWIRDLVHVVGIFLALGVAAYTGLLLAFANGKQFWHSPFLPWLFISSAVLTGVALVGLVETWIGDKIVPTYTSKNPRNLGIIETYLINLHVAELVLLLLFLVSVVSLAGDNVIAILVGAYALPFWLMLILGFAVPLAYASYGEKLMKKLGMPEYYTAGATISFILIIVGGFLMRYWVVLGGQI